MQGGLSVKKSILFILVAVLLLLSACGQDSQKDSDSVTKSDPTTLYDRFISGDISALSKNGDKVSINDYVDDSTYRMYAIYDMNGDTIPELLIKTVRDFTIFWTKNNELCVWYEGTSYCSPLNNMAVLSERPGGAPEHINYRYEVLGYNGETLIYVEFAEYSSFEYEGEQHPELYEINGLEVSKEVYTSLVTPLLNIKDDEIKWDPIPSV